jgi:hypothetical protein
MKYACVLRYMGYATRIIAYLYEVSSRQRNVTLLRQKCIENDYK